MTSTLSRLFPVAPLLALIVGCGGSTTAPPPATPSPPAVAPEKPTKPEEPVGPASIAGPAGFPLPADAEKSEKFGKIKNIHVFEVPRDRDVVIAEVKLLMQKGGWTIDSEEAAEGAARIKVSKDGTNVMVRIIRTAEDRSGIILTVP